MGNSLHLNVIAEGVEDLSQHAFLVEQGCQLFQGFLFGRPITLEAFEAAQRGDHPSYAQITVPDPMVSAKLN
jgi:EAL domain-containing protein (putative c-di-GMP-specific phosphodiesterase class I)